MKTLALNTDHFGSLFANDFKHLASLASERWPPPGSTVTVLKKNPKVESGTIILATAQKAVFYKDFPDPTGFLHLPKRFCRDRAKCNFTIADFLMRRGIACPTPYAAIRKKDRSIYLSAFMDGTVTLKQFYETRANNPYRTDIFAKAVQLVVDLHKAGVAHRDLKWGNFLVDANRIIITDLDSAKCYRHLPDRHAQADLARFLVSGLELDLGSGWADQAINIYCEKRNINKDAFRSRVCAVIRKISQKHGKRYNRPSISID